MAGGWGSSKNKIRIGVFWDGIEYNSGKTQARITDPRVEIDRGVNISDSSNSLSVSGGAVNDDSWSNISVSGSGTKRVKTVVGQWQTLDFGSTKKATFSASFAGINYAGGTLTASQTVTYPARPYSVPAAPTLGVVGRVSAASNSITVKWTNNATTEAPYTSLLVERSSDGGATWAVVSNSLSSSTVSWTDNLTVGDARYQYRVEAVNSAGTSPVSAASAVIYTNPSPPSDVKLSKLSTTVTLSWTNGAPFRTGTEITPYRAGVAAAAVTVTPATVSWVDPDLTTVEKFYTVRHVITGVPLAAGGTVNLYSEYVQSATIKLEGPPNPPTVSIAPTVIDAATTPTTLSWVHNPIDATAQRQYQVRYRYSTDNGATWSGYTTGAVTAGTASSIVYAAGALVNNRLYEFTVMTWGISATGSAFSDPAYLYTSTTPTVAITAPADGATVDTSMLGVTLTFTDPGGSNIPAAWEVLLFDQSGTQLWPEADESQTQPGTATITPFTIPYPLQDGVTYTVKVRAQDLAGLWSAQVSRSYLVKFAVPPEVDMLGTGCDAKNGRTWMTFQIPQPGPGEAAIASARIQRLTNGSWVEIADYDFNSENSPWVTTDPDNLSNNASFEEVEGSQEVRRSLFPYPRARSFTGYGTYAGTGGAATNTATENAAFATLLPHTSCVRMAWTTATTAASGGLIAGGTVETMPAAPGDVGSFSVVLCSSVAATIQVTAAFRNAAGVDVATKNTPVTLSANVAQRVVIDALTAPANTVCARITAYRITTNWAIGDTLDMTGVMYEKSPAMRAYFDGSFSPDADFSPMWAGDVLESPSYLTASYPALTSGVSGTLAVASALWAANGTQSLRVFPNSTSNDSYVVLAGSRDSLSGQGCTFKPGKTYVVQIRGRLAAALTGSLHANSRRVVAYFGPEPGSMTGATSVQSAAVANVVGEAAVNFEFMVPAIAEWAELRVYNGASIGGGNVWWDSFALMEKGPNTGAIWFDSHKITVVDPIPYLGEPNTYRIVTSSGIPTYTEGELFEIDCTQTREECVYPSGMDIFLTGGDDWTQQVKLVGGPAVKQSVEREKVLVTPVGRVLPVELLGIAVADTYDISGVVARDTLMPRYREQLESAREEWTAFALMPAPVLYRDPFGKRIFGSLGGVSADWDTTPVSSVSLTLTRTGGGDAA